MTGTTLDPLLLKSFVAVIESGSFTRAGERVHLSQSTVSQQLRRLEEQLGCALIDRSGRYMVATEDGERLLGYARRLLGLMEEAVEQLREGQVEGELRIGVPEDFASDRLTPALAALARAHPAIRLEVTSGLSNTLWHRTGRAAGAAMRRGKRPCQRMTRACSPPGRICQRGLRPPSPAWPLLSQRLGRFACKNGVHHLRRMHPIPE
jgi:DNA-binding transcriptional LysR family regulator